MEPLDEYPLGVEPGGVAPEPVEESGGHGWVVVAACLLVFGGAIAFFLVRPSREAPVTGTAPPAPVAAAEPPAAARKPLGPEVEPRDLPPLDLTDPIVRDLLKGLSSSPQLAAWLATDGLLRNAAVAIDNVARGVSPSPRLRRLAPSRPFSVEAHGSTSVIDARSYARYDAIADTVAGLDADGMARTYVTLRPRLQEAYRELGHPDGNIDDAVQRAIARLLDTPVMASDMAVRPSPVLYKFTDERIESLSPAQKQLLRMGPRNVRLIQDKLREIAAALHADTRLR
jgi:hypothetical protein